LLDSKAVADNQTTQQLVDCSHSVKFVSLLLPTLPLPWPSPNCHAVTAANPHLRCIAAVAIHAPCLLSSVLCAATSSPQSMLPLLLLASSHLIASSVILTHLRLLPLLCAAVMQLALSSPCFWGCIVAAAWLIVACCVVCCLVPVACRLLPLRSFLHTCSCCLCFAPP